MKRFGWIAVVAALACWATAQAGRAAAAHLQRRLRRRLAGVLPPAGLDAGPLPRRQFVAGTPRVRAGGLGRAVRPDHDDYLAPLRPDARRDAPDSAGHQDRRRVVLVPGVAPRLRRPQGLGEGVHLLRPGARAGVAGAGQPQRLPDRRAPFQQRAGTGRTSACASWARTPTAGSRATSAQERQGRGNQASGQVYVRERIQKELPSTGPGTRAWTSSSCTTRTGRP